MRLIEEDKKWNGLFIGALKENCHLILRQDEKVFQFAM